MAINFDTYNTICDLLFMVDTDGFPTYSVDEIADLVGVSADCVRYVDSAESI